MKTRTVQQGASLFVGRFVGECMHLRSACREEPKKSTVGFSGQVPNQAQVREDGQTYAEKEETEQSIVFWALAVQKPEILHIAYINFVLW